MDLTKTIALVTGANRGIGRATADALVDAGVTKIYAASRAGDIAATATIVPLKLDITDPTSIAQAVASCGDATLLINNAGIVSGGGPLSAPTMEGARAEIETNYFGTLSMARAFAPVIEKNGGGAIVTLASILALAPIPQVGTYSASKAAVHSLVLSLRAELSGRGVSVVSVLPAFVSTRMTANVQQEKLPPEAVASALIDGLRCGAQDIYPGTAGRMQEAFHADPAGYAAKLGASSASGTEA